MAQNKGGPSKDGRRRCWACVVYPESAPSDWLDDVAQWAVPAAVSPLHDQDMNPDGQPKKAHYHLMVYWGGKKSEEGARELFQQINGVGCIPIQSPEGYCRYLVHKDNPEKHQYDPAGIRTFGGFDLMRYLNNNADKTQTIREMQEFCRKEKIYSFSDLMDYAADNNESWYTGLCTYCSALMMRYVRSLEYKDEQEHKKKIKKLEEEYEAKKSDMARDIGLWEAQRKRHNLKMRQYEAYIRNMEAQGYTWDEASGNWTRKGAKE